MSVFGNAKSKRTGKLERPIEVAELALKVLSGHTKSSVQEKAGALLEAAIDDLLNEAGVPAKED